MLNYLSLHIHYLWLLVFIISCSHIKIDNNTLNRNPVILQNKYSKGKILIVPLNGKGSIGLYNKKGYFEKVWTLKLPTFYGELMGGNKILVVHMNKIFKKKKGISDLYKIPEKPFYMLGSTGIISIYDYNGKLQSSFEDISLHHDISVKNQQKIFALSWEVKPFLYKKKSFMVVEDSIIEIDIKHSKVIKKLPLSNYFPIDKYLNISKKYPQESRLNDIFHTNSIDYIKENPINGNEAVLITMRNYNGGTLALIDLKINKVLWKSKKGVFVRPHDGSFTKDKTVTLFNNGTKEGMNSSVYEFDIRTNKVLWKLEGQNRKNLLFRFRFFSPALSGIQKVENGYLITVGNQGRILEVSKNKDVTWELPAGASFFHSDIDNSLVTEIFKVRQYQ